MRNRPFLVGAAAGLAIIAAAPAWAHEEINPKSFPTGQPTFLTLTAANEASADLTRVVLKAPAGLAFGDTTRSPAGWSADGGDDTITWTGGAVKPDTFETFGFEIDGADQPGTLTYKVTLGYAGGKTDAHDVEVTAFAPAAAGAGAAGTPAASVTTGAASAPTATTAAASEAGSDSSSDASGTAKAALAVAIVALLVAAGALAVGSRRRGGPGPNPTPGSGGRPGAAQDW